jgi:hypothetical protein
MSSFKPTSTHYKLCVKIGEKLYCFSDRTKEMSLFKTITQSIEASSNPIFVFPNIDSSLSDLSDFPYYSNPEKYPKTIVKVLCMGDQRQLGIKSAFSSMTVLQEVPLPSTNAGSLLLSSTSGKKPLKSKPKINPLFQTRQKIYLDVRINSSSKARCKSNPKRTPSDTRPLRSGSNSRAYSKVKPRPNNTVQRSLMDSVYQKFRMIKKEMQWLDDEVKFLENMRKLDKIEESESIMTSLDQI